MREVKLQLRRHMNGTTASIMKRLDDAYAANYGLSLQHVREVAASLSLAPQECDDLWQTRWRDLMLIAAAALAPQDPEPRQVLAWAESLPSVEMVEMLPFLLTGHMSRSLELAEDLAARDSGFDFALALNTAARSMQYRPSPALEVADVANGLLRAAAARDAWSRTEAAAVSLLARQCVRQGACHKAVEAVRASAMARHDAPSRLVAQDIADEVEFLKS